MLNSTLWQLVCCTYCIELVYGNNLGHNNHSTIVVCDQKLRSRGAVQNQAFRNVELEAYENRVKLSHNIAFQIFNITFLIFK